MMSQSRAIELIVHFQLPNVVNQDLCAKTNHYYNRGVLNTFEFLSKLPEKSSNLYKCAAKQLEKMTKTA